MSAFCGWMNARWPDDVTDAARGAMSRACIDGSSSRPAIAASSSATIVTVDGLVPVLAHRTASHLVALMGHVTWEGADFTRIAQDGGAGDAIIRAYEREGADCVKRMHGPFALVVVDEARRQGLLALDRMAIRTLCYARAGGGIVFGTTTTTVAAHPAVGRTLSQQGIYNYLYGENVSAPSSIFEGVVKLLPGQRVVVDGSAMRTDFYWQLDYTPRPDVPRGAQRTEFRRLLTDCVERAATSETLGAFLSGGTDSSTVAGILTQLRNQPVDTYSIGFEAEGFDEMEYARITSRHFRTRAHEYYVTPRDVVNAIPLIAAAYDEPFGNASAVPTYYCARLAREDGKSLLLAGDGGDEIFGGNERYATQKVFDWYDKVPSFVRRGLLEPVLFSGDWVERVTLLRKARSYVQQARIPLPDRLETYNFLEREALADIFEPEFLRTVDPHQPRDVARDVYARTSSMAAVNRMMQLDLKVTLADNDLRKVNRMCELAGIAVRFPLLDDALVEFSGHLDPSEKVKGVKLRPFFKESLADFLPAETIRKTKHGFGLPFGLWLQRDATLNEMAHESLTSFKRRGYVRSSYVDRLLQQHQTTHASYYGVMIWIVMMLERWLVAHET